ncbi:MAG TPA: zinc ABC transporter substrate-binding protein [Lentimicrobium sp.]|nr:zinc ABC transporter substrate-binding protein [Lentimicrobium sp.]
MRNILFYLLLFSLISCRPHDKSRVDNYITVSIRPQKYIVEQIAGDRFKVNVLVPDGSGPETYEPTTRQMRELAKSQVYFTMGLLDFEKKWAPMLTDLHPEMDVVDVTDGIQLLSGSHHHHEDENLNHDANDHLQASNTPEAVDPHIWLSLRTVKIQSDNILRYLTAKFPDEKDAFNDNHKKFINSIDSLDRVLIQMFSGGAEPFSFIIYHPSLSYFANDYGLIQIPIELEGKEPSPAYLKELIDTVKDKKLTTVFYSEQFDKKSAQVLADQLDISLTSFNPLAENIEENLLSVSKKIVESKTE